ncbi:MAG: invasion associated locus B family protein [Alphaproteobacteria bacterium]
MMTRWMMRNLGTGFRKLRHAGAAAIAMALLAGLVATGARAAAPTFIGMFGAWAAYEAEVSGNDGAGRVCYIASEPYEDEGNYTRRGDIFAQVSHWPGRNGGVTGEVSFIAGYTYEEGSTVEVTVGGRAFKLFTQNNKAWLASQADEEALVQAMIRGTDMVVTGTSSRGTLTTDTYSLKGFTAAYRKISEACGTG